MIRLANLREAAAIARAPGHRLGLSVKRWRIVDYASLGLVAVIPFCPWFAVAFVLLRFWISYRVHASHTRRAVSLTVAAYADATAIECSYWDAILTDVDPALAKWIDEQYAKAAVSETPTE